jgi:hypothetical protein
MTFLGAYWYSPKYPIDSRCSLNDCHKAKGNYLSKVSPLTLAEVEMQLEPAIIGLYKNMVD